MTEPGVTSIRSHDRFAVRTRRVFRVGGAVAIVLTGCAESGPDVEPAAPTSFVVRDSAGVRIVENRDSLWTEASAWRIEAAPVLVIGTSSGDRPGTDFGRIGPVVRFGDGRIAVTELQSMEIRVFDAAGAFLGAWGGRGAGPGELQYVNRLAVRAGDSLVARNDRSSRHEVYGPEGGFGRTVRAPPIQWLRGDATAVAWFDDGSFLFGPANATPDARLPAGRHLLEGEWHLFDPAGEHVAMLARLSERWVEAYAGNTATFAIAYGARAHVAGSPNGVWYGFPATFELRRIGRTGVDRIVRRAWSPESATPQLEDAYRAWFQEPGRVADIDPAMLPEVVMVLRAQQGRTGSPADAPLTFADTLPAFVEVLATRDGSVWARLPARLRDLVDDPAHLSTDDWTVFDPDGRWLGTVTTPPQLQVREIGADYVLGVWRDSLDVPYVHMHRLIKPEATGL